MPNIIERAAAEAMGAAKDIQAGFKGLSGVFRHLMEEHGKVGTLIKRLQLDDADVEVRKRLFPTIRAQLLAHERAELQVVYPALAEFPETATIAAAHAHHASELEASLIQLDALAFDSPSWLPALQHLAQVVDQHVLDEENDYFPRGQRALGDARAERLLVAFEAAKHANHS